MTTRGTGLRILIGAESLADAEAALRLVERLPDRDMTELGGLLLRAADIGAIPRLARQRLVTPGGALLPAPDTPAAGWPAREATQFRARLAAVARSRRWVFQDQPEEIGRIARFTESWDVVILGCRLLHRLPGRVVLVAGAGGASPETARFAGDIARSLGTETATLPNDAQLLARLARIPAAAVVLDLGPDPLPGPAALRALIDAARCPVILSRSQPPG